MGKEVVDVDQDTKFIKIFYKNKIYDLKIYIFFDIIDRYEIIILWRIFKNGYFYC